MFYLMTHNTFFNYGYMASDIWLMTILIVRKETRCHHIGYSFQLTTRVLLYAPSHRQDSTYHGLCYTSRGALAGTRNSSMGPPHERIWLRVSYLPVYKRYILVKKNILKDLMLEYHSCGGNNQKSSSVYVLGGIFGR